MGYSELTFERRGHVAVVMLNRPDKLNALNAPLRNDVYEVCREVREDDDLRAVVFTGAGAGFCSGVDLTSGDRPPPPTEGSQNYRLDRLGWVGRQALAIYGLDKPTIAAVNGVAAGAGMGLALACDLRVGGPSARFRTVFAERNLSPDAGLSWFLPRVVGYSRASDLLFSSRPVDAAEAFRIGLLDRLVESDGELVDAAVELAETMAALPPIAIRTTKQVLQHNLGVSLEEGLQYEIFGQSYMRRAPNDAKEAMAAFREKRKPDYTGT